MLRLRIPEKLSLVKSSLDSNKVSTANNYYKCDFNSEGLRDKCGVILNYITEHHGVINDAAKYLFMDQDPNHMHKYD